MRSPLAGDDTARFRRGILIHRLLQSLPDLAEGERGPAMERFLTRRRVETPLAAEIAAEVAAVLALCTEAGRPVVPQGA